jgi:hypothetical protein
VDGKFLHQQERQGSPGAIPETPYSPKVRIWAVDAGDLLADELGARGAARERAAYQIVTTTPSAPQPPEIGAGDPKSGERSCRRSRCARALRRRSSRDGRRRLAIAPPRLRRAAVTRAGTPWVRRRSASLCAVTRSTAAVRGRPRVPLRRCSGRQDRRDQVAACDRSGSRSRRPEYGERRLLSDNLDHEIRGDPWLLSSPIQS